MACHVGKHLPHLTHIHIRRPRSCHVAAGGAAPFSLGAQTKLAAMATAATPSTSKPVAVKQMPLDSPPDSVGSRVPPPVVAVACKARRLGVAFSKKPQQQLLLTRRKKAKIGEQEQEQLQNLHHNLQEQENYQERHPSSSSPRTARSMGSHWSNGAVARTDSEVDPIWLQMREEARRDAEAEPALASYLYSTILAHRSLERALAFHLGNKLSSTTLLSTQLFTMFVDTFMEDSDMREAIRADISAVRERDPACISYSHCMLNFKGFLACQAHRVSHRLWTQGRHSLALALQSRVSEVFHVDIHPAAKIGRGVLFDHATGLVVGETASIGNNVSILHNVTLGGTGAFVGDRHPKICDGVLIGAGAIILGPVRIGEGAKIGAGSVVLIEVPPHTTAVGNPARLVGGKQTPAKLKDIPSETMDHTSFISTWSDYVI